MWRSIWWLAWGVIIGLAILDRDWIALGIMALAGTWIAVHEEEHK